MKKLTLILASLCVFALVLCKTETLIVGAPAPMDDILSEAITIGVDCIHANLTCLDMISSNNDTLIHFPSGVDMSNSQLENVTAIGLTFSTSASFLLFEFNNTDENTALATANSLVPSVATSFDTSFVMPSSGSSGTYVNVTYSGDGKNNLATYIDWLTPRCLKSDLAGFSSAFSAVGQEPNAIFSVLAEKESGGFLWTYMMMVGYSTPISTGTGSHTVDVLDALNVANLSPSPYAGEVTMTPFATMDTTYMSSITLTITASTAILFDSCQPDLSVGNSRGWTYLNIPSNMITAMFTYSNDSSPVSQLSFTFTGTVLPELSTLSLIIVLMTASLIALVFKRRILKP
jgi:hypothetical protein